MKLLKNFTFAALAIAAIGFTSCNEPCEGVTCPEGFVCDDGTCIEDPDADPCILVTCPEGYTCIDGECLETNPADPVEVVSGFITENTTWSADNIYELAGKVVVDGGATLSIEPGTIVKGREGTGTLASALVIARGAKIEACGTADKPIIFTSVLDNIKIGELTGSNLTEIDAEKWGGLIICGNAPSSTGDGDTLGQIEGIPADEEYGKYGGDNPSDNSGSLCYVSIRHGGALIGDGNEINGLTLGGVGNGTTINHIEVVANLDDGIECFGGTVNISHAIVAFQGDDALDLDQNYSGIISNFYVVHGGDTDEALEIDGPEGSTYTDGKFTLNGGTVRSVDGEGSAADLKSKAQGTIENVVFMGYNTFVKVSASFNDDCSVKTDAYDKVLAGELIIRNSEFVGASDLYLVHSKSDCLAAVESEYNTNLDNAWSGNGNTSPATATIGADKSELTGWSWADAKGFIQ